MSNNDSKPKSNINIEIDEKIAEGTYSNLAIINHSVSEFVLDFICIMPGTPKNKVKSRIIITPQHAKRLVKALNDNVVRFEKKHGEIKENQHDNMFIGKTWPWFFSYIIRYLSYFTINFNNIISIYNMRFHTITQSFI
jgi:hypothetical protein